MSTYIESSQKINIKMRTHIQNKYILFITKIEFENGDTINIKGFSSSELRNGISTI